MSTVEIDVKLPGGSWTDITTSCLFSRCSFSSQFNGVPGSFDIMVKDPDRVLSFTTGSEIRLLVDGATQFGGYITTVGMTSLAPAADTADLSTYDLRLWHLTGPDYNIVFDRRVVRNTADYLTGDIWISTAIDGVFLRSMVDTYADMSDFSSAGIDDIATVPDLTKMLLTQGKLVRFQFENLLPISGAVYYISGDKVVQYKSYDNVVKRWGFSDAPNHTPITVSPDAYQGATYGFASVEATEDASQMANDVFAWGGSAFAGAAGGAVVARYQDAVSTSTTTSNSYIQHGTVTAGSSIDTHGRWQHAEVHFGEDLYMSLNQVKVTANEFVNGSPGLDPILGEKGLRNPQWTFTFGWNSDQVPKLSGVRDHIIAGDLVTIEMTVFGITKLLPVRQLTITFPDAFDTAPPTDRLVHFEGTFGLQLSDSFTLWRYILKNQNAVVVQTQAVVTPSSGSTTFGASFRGEPTPVTDGATVLFTLAFGYVAGTLEVYKDGLLLRPGTDFTETDPVAGTFTMASPPAGTSWLFATCTTLSS